MVLPAYAGMIPHVGAVEDPGVGAPRLRGDDPMRPPSALVVLACSPPMRG